MWIYRKSFIDKTGKRVYAQQYGHKAFRFWVDDPIPPMPEDGSFTDPIADTVS